MLEKEDFALISHFSQGIIDDATWYMDSGELKHMTVSLDVFTTLVVCESELHMVLGDKSEKEIKG